MASNIEIFDSKSFHRFIFNDVFEQYKKILFKTNIQYINYYEIYDDFVKSNFYYLNYVYTKLWFCKLLKEKDSHSGNEEIKALYSLCYPNLNKSLIIDRYEKDFEIIKNIYVNRCLYHYTSSTALISILNNHELWFSNISRSKDCLEGEYLDRYFSIYHKDCMSNFAELKEKVNVYSFSLSFQSDDVAQWSRYGEKEDKNEGVCLVFDCNMLFSYLKCFYPYIGTFFMSPLKYAEFDKITMKDFVAELAWQNLTTYEKSMLNNLRFVFKDKSFISEKEYRLFFCFDKLSDKQLYLGKTIKKIDDDFRAMIIPKEDFPKIIPKIVFGPNLLSDKKEKIKECLKDNYGKKIEYLESACSEKK